jgi:hypothetical protein
MPPKNHHRVPKPSKPPNDRAPKAPRGISVVVEWTFPGLDEWIAEREELLRRCDLTLAKSAQSSMRLNLWLLLVLWLQWKGEDWEVPFTQECREAMLDSLTQLDALRNERPDLPEMQEAAQFDPEGLLQGVYERARVSVAQNRVSRNKPMPLAGLPTICPWTWAQICDQEFEPDMKHKFKA